MPIDPCPCCSDKPFAKCCEPFLSGARKPKTVKQVMRSRFSAYKLGGYGEYLVNTWHPQFLRGVTASSLAIKTTDWRKLTIVDSMQEADKGAVEFKAEYVDEKGKLLCHHEVSVFARIKGVWYYTDGKVETLAVEE